MGKIISKDINNKIKEKGGIITSEDLRVAEIPTVYLSRMVEDDKLIRVDRGIYIDKNGDYDEYYFFNKRYKVPVFSYMSALYIHGLSDIIPQKMEVTVYSGYNAHRFKDYVDVKYSKKDIYELGITYKDSIYGNPLKVYNIDKTICDLIKKREEMDAEVFSKALKKYIAHEEKDLKQLYYYAKKMKIYEKVQKLMELML